MDYTFLVRYFVWCLFFALTSQIKSNRLTDCFTFDSFILAGIPLFIRPADGLGNVLELTVLLDGLLNNVKLILLLGLNIMDVHDCDQIGLKSQSRC